MSEALRFEYLDPTRHDRAGFDCGVPALNDYLKTKLGQHSRRDLTRGYVLVSGQRTIAGYLTLAASRLSVSMIPPGEGFPPRMPLPTTLIGRLAVDTRFRGQGLGELLLTYGLKMAVAAAESVASAAIEVDAKDDAAKRFYERYLFKSLLDDPRHMYLPMATAREFIRSRED